MSLQKSSAKRLETRLSAKSQGSGGMSGKGDFVNHDQLDAFLEAQEKDWPGKVGSPLQPPRSSAGTKSQGASRKPAAVAKQCKGMNPGVEDERTKEVLLA